ncbi:PAS domain-containing sensor histidine kinase [Muricauda brasiliensis]|uniref:PAS domain-containing sensor histidine kinase n=1 Tax=Muricauda brasiliensis TaxID=2162892 RepID=UPI000D3DC2B2|nr:PAS domain-containing sensor histidine kinase [Muricauda brasiliensis]
MAAQSHPVKNETIDDALLYRNIYDSMNIAVVIVTDANGKILKWNKGVENTFGYCEDEILGRPYSLLMDRKYGKLGFSEFVKRAKSNEDLKKNKLLQFKCLHKSGRKFPVEFVMSKLNSNGKNLYALKMLDITKRIEVQNRLKQKTKELELFLYRSAHDLNAPFSSAQGLINLMRDEYSIEKMKTLLGMLENTISCAKVMSEGLAKASLVSEKVKSSKPIDFEILVGHVLTSLKRCHNFDQIKFNVDIKVAHEYVSNPDLIFAVFQNLIKNSIKYSLPRTKDHTPFIEIKVSELSDRTEIMVCDNGKGIRRENLGRIFDMYYRAEVEEFSGSNGLGLYIVKRIVENLNGTIDVESRVKVGACFHIILPKNIKTSESWE